MSATGAISTTPEVGPDLAAPQTGRLQLALNVDDLDAAIEFYSRMFGVRPVKVKPGYANFAIAEPPLKLVLFSGAGEPGTLNHLGVEVTTADAVSAADARLRADGLETTEVAETNCCLTYHSHRWPSGASSQVSVLAAKQQFVSATSVVSSPSARRRASAALTASAVVTSTPR